MEEKLRELTEGFDRNAGATEASLQKLESELGIALPAQYIEFMKYTNGAEGGFENGAYVSIWPVEEIKSLNEEYAVNEFAPGLLLFGSDGGGTAYAFDTRSSDLPVVEVPFIGMDLDAMRLLGHDFIEFVEYLSGGR